jgi:antitoxin (DNA-binding transcriptional repressor) of toxin-antitoxin stability system
MRMKTISSQEAKTHLAHYLNEVEQGEEFKITRGKSVVAMLVPVKTEPILRPRPKVGEIMGPVFHFNEDAFAPMTEEELKEWGL